MSKAKKKRKIESSKDFESPEKNGWSEYPRKKLSFSKEQSLIPVKEGDEFTDQERLLIKYIKLKPFTVKALVSNTLVELNLSYILVPYHSTAILGDILKINTSIKYLKLIQSGIGAPGVVNIAKGLAFNNTIVHLDISCNGSGCIGTKELTKSLSKNSSLTYLNLSQNHINIKGGQDIGDLLVGNSSIKELDVEGNNIGNTGGTSIAGALKTNTTLRVLRISGNFITEKGMKDIYTSLCSNKGLITLDISNNPVCSKKCELLASSLEQNTTLTEIDMTSTYVSSSGAVIIDRAMKHNFTVKSFALEPSAGITKGLFDSMQKQVKRNSVLQDKVYKFVEAFDKVPKPIMTLDIIKLFQLLGRSSIPALKERLKSADISSEKVFKSLEPYHAEEFLAINLICKKGLPTTKTSFSKLESLPSMTKTMVGEFLGIGFLGGKSTEVPAAVEVSASVGLAGATDHYIEVFDA